MTLEEKKERNNAIYGEYFEMFLRGEKKINEKLGAKYNLNPGSISRIRNTMLRERYGNKK